MVSAGDMAEHRPSFAFQAKPGGLQGNVDHGTTPEPSGFIPGPEQKSSQVQSAAGGQSPPNGPFVIFLTYAGTRVAHRVWDSMGISQLIAEAGLVFSLDPSEVTLMFFSMTPTSLHRGAKISGPPRVTAGSTVMVFHLPIARSTATAPYLGRTVDPSPLPPLSTKLLANFKLPKFDGVARSWKQWEKAFVKFLGIHQLDHVLEENFLDTMWTVPGATAANKMVYFLVEDAVATGTLASRLIRQATQWNGHEAFVLLRNGYVFNGPQTATILLAESLARFASNAMKMLLLFVSGLWSSSKTWNSSLEMLQCISQIPRNWGTYYRQSDMKVVCKRFTRSCSPNSFEGRSRLTRRAGNCIIALNRCVPTIILIVDLDELCFLLRARKRVKEASICRSWLVWLKIVPSLSNHTFRCVSFAICSVWLARFLPYLYATTWVTPFSILAPRCWISLQQSLHLVFLRKG